MRQFHVVWWKVTYCCCWGSRQMNTLLVSRGMFYSEWKPITQWIPRRRNAGSPVITLWFHPSLISIACYILSVIYRSQRALVLYLHFTPMPLNATQQIRLILTSNFFALDLVEVALNLFFFLLCYNHKWFANELGKGDTEGKGEIFRQRSCLHIPVLYNGDDTRAFLFFYDVVNVAMYFYFSTSPIIHSDSCAILIILLD